MNHGQDMNLGQDHNDQDDDYDQDEDGECGQMSLMSDPSKMQIECQENYSVYEKEKSSSYLKDTLYRREPERDQAGECLQNSLINDPNKMQIEIEGNHSIRVEDKLASQLKNTLLVNPPEKRESERKEPHSITGNNIGWLQVQDLKNAKSTKSQLIQKLLRRGYYLPCHRECTASFLRAVFAGKKRVFRKNEIRWVGRIPKFAELASRKVHEMIKSDVGIIQYLPEYGKREPERDYLFNVINTATAGRMDVVIENQYLVRQQNTEKSAAKSILVLPEFEKLLKDDSLAIGGRGRIIALLMEAASQVKPRKARTVYSLKPI